jgi:hypothetical protein
MKVEVYYEGNSIAIDTYEGEHIDWMMNDKQLTIYVGTKEEVDRVASYPESRVVRVRTVE